MCLDLDLQHPFIISEVLSNLRKVGGTLRREQLVERVFSYVYGLLSSKDGKVQKNASLVFYEICRNNPSFVNGHLESFYDLLLEEVPHYENILKGVAHCLS